MHVHANDWDQLSNHPDLISSKRFLYRLHQTLPLKPLYLGQEISTLNRCIMFHSRRADLVSRDLPVTKGLEIRFDFSFAGSDEVGVLLKLLSEDFLDVYVALVNDLIGNLYQAPDEEQFVEIFFTRLGFWRLLLDEGAAGGLGPERRRGLFGELTFLSSRLLPAWGGRALKFWSGPSGAVHDFEMGSCAVEVKSSKRSQRLQISSERQLDDTGYGALFLCEYALIIRSNARPTLVDLVGRIESSLRAQPQALVEFQNKLLLAGYTPVHEDQYQAEGYQIEQARYYRVGEGFPRLTRSDLKPGVGDLKYSIDVSACAAFQVSEAEVDAWLGREQ